MIILLDTSILIDLDNRQKTIVEKLATLKSLYPEVPKISFITYFEFIHGLRKKLPHNKYRPMAFIENFDVIQTTKTTANILSVLKEKYGDTALSDLLIAAQAIENNMIVVTKDKDFEKIEELNKIIL